MRISKHKIMLCDPQMRAVVLFVKSMHCFSYDIRANTYELKFTEKSEI